MIELKGKYNRNCKIFIDDVEQNAIELIRNILDHEVSAGVPVRIMPDTHTGVGIVIGFTMPVTRMVNPTYIGVDIGCSVTTYKLNKCIPTEQFPALDHSIRRSVPMGRYIRKDKTFDDRWVESYFEAVNRATGLFREEWKSRFGEEMPAIQVDREYIMTLCKKVKIGEKMFYHSVGTLGGGNHFIELGESAADGSHYVTIHSGSRNFGLKVCNYHTKKMRMRKNLPESYFLEKQVVLEKTEPKSNIPQKLKELNERYLLHSEQLLTGADMYEYLQDMIITQTYARFNHQVMSEEIFKVLGADYYAVEIIHSMHNFIDMNDWIIRKGAIRSYEGEKMIIPFNMRDGILICEGKSNPDWNCSAPHGAGRVLARGKAFQTLNMDEFTREMEGIYSTSVCRRTLDESPMAYKDKQVILDAIQDTAIIVDTIRPLINIKALS